MVITQMLIPVNYLFDIFLFSPLYCVFAVFNSILIYDGRKVIHRIAYCMSGCMHHCTCLSDGMTNGNILFILYFFCKGMAIQYLSLCCPHFDFSGCPVFGCFQCFPRALLFRIIFFQYFNGFSRKIKGPQGHAPMALCLKQHK